MVNHQWSSKLIISLETDIPGRLFVAFVTDAGSTTLSGSIQAVSTSNPKYFINYYLKLRFSKI